MPWTALNISTEVKLMWSRLDCNLVSPRLLKTSSPLTFIIIVIVVGDCSRTFVFEAINYI